MSVDVESQEFKDAVQAATDTAVAGRLETETKGLKDSRDQLLGEKKALEKRFEGIDPDEYKTLKGAKRTQEDKDSDPVKLRERIEAELNPKLTEAEKRAQDAEGKLNARIIDGDLTNALTGAKVAPEMLPAVKALLQASRKVEVSNDGGAIVDGKPVADFVKAWSTSDEAKPFIAASQNGGGGAGGGGGGASSGKKASEMNAKEKADFILEHGGDAFKQKVDKERQT